MPQLPHTPAGGDHTYNQEPIITFPAVLLTQLQSALRLEDRLPPPVSSCPSLLPAYLALGAPGMGIPDLLVGEGVWRQNGIRQIGSCFP